MKRAMYPSKTEQERPKLAAMLCLLLSIAGATATAADYKLYINKDQNNGNVVVFKDSMTASVTHTAEGLELVIPGVDVQLRCKSNTAATGTDACVIAVQAGATATSTATSSNTTSGTTSTTGTSSSGDCTVTTWNNCDGSTSSGGTTTTTSTTSGSGGTTGTTTSTDGGGAVGSTSNGCTSDGATSCYSYDFGPGGNSAGAGVVEIAVNPGKVSVLPITTFANAKNFGTISRYPTSAQEVTNGAIPRLWISQKPKGAPLSSNGCNQIGGIEGSLRWYQPGSRGMGCSLDSGIYFLNIAWCISSSSDTTCSASGATAADRTAYLYLKGDYSS